MDAKVNVSNKETILKKLALFSLPDGGIGSWLSNETDEDVFERLAQIDENPLTRVQLNQLLAFGHEAPLSEGFFKYYWLTCPDGHPYEVQKIPHYDDLWLECDEIQSLEHLSWGLYRLFIDGLMWFGNVRTAYRSLRTKDFSSLEKYFIERRFDTDLIRSRGPVLGLLSIAKDNRYLISEMACKSYGDTPQTSSELKKVLLESFERHSANGGGRISIKKLIEGNIPPNFEERQSQFIFSADDVLEEIVETKEEIDVKYQEVAEKFFTAREAALKNTYLYLSMVGELDVYVATSMRSRDDFRKMANVCEEIFSHSELKKLAACRT